MKRLCPVYIHYYLLLGCIAFHMLTKIKKIKKKMKKRKERERERMVAEKK